ncbi:hypothetical protein A4A49_59849, partial [Nicotiana attenuata]
LALREKSKLGFVDGSCKSMYKGELAKQWEKCNAIKVWAYFQERFDRSNLTRIYNLWTAIATVRRGTDSVTSYYSKMKDLWDELDVIVPLASCDCEKSRPSVELMKNIRLLQFLMGLNESYGNIRSNVLAKRPVVTVNEAYAIVTQEESQRTMGVTDTLKDPLTMMSGKSHEFRPKRPGLVCDYCGYKGHLKENCYKIVGYPLDFNSKKKGQNSGGRTYVNNETTSIIALIANIAANDHVWIVDSGATHHVTHCKNVLSNFKRADNRTDGVQLPTGNKADITHTGDAIVLGYKTIEGVLHVPDFKFNLLSVSKVTKQLCCSVGFYPDFCIFQGLYNGKVMGISRENN